MCFISKGPRKKPKPKARKPKARKPKFLSLRNHLAPPPTPTPTPTPTLPPPSEPTTMQEQENIDAQVACLLEHDNGGPTITDLFAGSSTSNNSSLVVDEAFSPASPSVNWDGMARKALRGREKWVFCKSTVGSSSSSSSSSVSEHLDLFGRRGGGDQYSRQGLLLKLDYEEVMTAWSDRRSLYIDGEGPQVVPELSQQYEDDSIISSSVFVEVGNGGVWSVPEMEVAKEEQVKEGDRGSREAKVLRYKEKRQNRLFAKRIRYEVRKLNAEKRPRIKGRFVKRVDDM